MENNFVMVRSASDWTLVINVPHLNLSRTWLKRGQKYPIDRSALVQAYYDPAVETLFKEGSLVVDDVDFLREVGLLDEETKQSVVYELTDQKKIRMIKLCLVSVGNTNFLVSEYQASRSPCGPRYRDSKKRHPTM